MELVAMDFSLVIMKCMYEPENICLLPHKGSFVYF